MIIVSECCRLNRRRRAIIEAARALFVEKGYENTTLGDIVDRAGGSLATVYKLFGNKDGLLEAAVFEHASAGDVIVGKAAEAGGSPATVLHRIAAAFDTHFLDAETVALVRIVIARSISDQAFARQFFERTATRTRAALEGVFEDWLDAGVTMNGSPKFLAELFLGQFVSDVHAEAISHGLGVVRTPERLSARTEFFIAGAGLKDRQPAPVAT